MHTSDQCEQCNLPSRSGDLRGNAIENPPDQHQGTMRTDLLNCLRAKIYSFRSLKKRTAILTVWRTFPKMDLCHIHTALMATDWNAGMAEMLLVIQNTPWVGLEYQSPPKHRRGDNVIPSNLLLLRSPHDNQCAIRLCKLITSEYITKQELKAIQTLLKYIRLILYIPVTADNLLILSSDGVMLCQLLIKCGIPCRYNANPQHVVACRDNLATYLLLCTKTFGIPSGLWFEVDNFLDPKNIRQILTFLIHFVQHPDVKFRLDRAAHEAETEWPYPLCGNSDGDADEEQEDVEEVSPPVGRQLWPAHFTEEEEEEEEIHEDSKYKQAEAGDDTLAVGPGRECAPPASSATQDRVTNVRALPGIASVGRRRRRNVYKHTPLVEPHTQKRLKCRRCGQSLQLKDVLNKHCRHNCCP